MSGGGDDILRGPFLQAQPGLDQLEDQIIDAALRGSGAVKVSHVPASEMFEPEPGASGVHVDWIREVEEVEILLVGVVGALGGGSQTILPVRQSIEKLRKVLAACADLKVGADLDGQAEMLEPEPMDVPGYELLARVLQDAYDQAARGKGKERHANGRAFEDQPMQDLIRMNGLGFATGQVGKKASEALALPAERAIAELLGAINYCAGAVIAIRRDGMEALKR